MVEISVSLGVRMQRFWWSGEIEGDAFNPYRETMRAVESVIGPLLDHVSFGANAEKWAYIAIIRSVDHPDYDEVVRRSSKGKVLEFRLRIPYTAFLSGSRDDRIRLVLGSLARCVSLMENLRIAREVQDSLRQVLLRTEYELLLG
jgi:hypothetical protein